MDNQIIVALIASGGAIFIALLNTFFSRKKTSEILTNSQELSEQTRNQLKYNRLSKDQDYYLEKLNDFYYPLKNYLDSSRNFYDIFKIGKPKGFRTLTYLLDRNQTYNNVGKVILTTNDTVLLEKIFEIGSEIEKLIASKRSIIDDKEFINPYVPSAEFSEVKNPEGKSLLSLTLSFIRMAYQGYLQGDTEKYAMYVYPRELNIKVDEQIEKLEKLKSKCEEEMKAITH
jgi:hypothetical protein